MKKTTIKISWDNLQAINKIANEEATKRGVKVTQDQVVRILIEESRK